tara:strand:+ start:2687 stop:2935 length:249 start_codon:yes stop_codon:yes gene_type:complete
MELLLNDEDALKQLQEKRKIRNQYARTYRKKNLTYLREYQKQWERENRSITARKQGRYNKPGIGKLEIKTAETGKPFLIVFD